MSNRLAHEKSLYLRQHAENPVDWWPWCSEAFEEAKHLNRPVLISIGYSACHWCHVMAHECFEDTFIAGIMNRRFICIKVDREERPDVDSLFMEAVQMITGRGGWPLNAFCLPDGRPFFGGTYFPPEDRGQGIIPWPQLLMRVADHFDKEPEDLLENAENILKNLQHANHPFGISDTPFQNDSLIQAAEEICQSHDDKWGGFGSAPKFPHAMTLNFLMEVRATKACENVENLPRRLDQCIQRTLRGMARGGIYDQIGGGFARYSVDEQWLIPHFEKMLYDNALLLEAYTRGFLRYKRPEFRCVVEETIAWLEREMRLPEGGYAAALDADTDGQEGKSYVWTPAEIKAVLGDADGQRFCECYLITEDGNFEDGLSNPALNRDSFSTREALAPLREKLLAVRNERPQPGRDDKMILSWNALLARALAEAGYYMEKSEWLEHAASLLDTLWDTCHQEDGTLRAVAYAGEAAAIPGTLDDYATLADACLSLCGKTDTLAVGASDKWLARARSVADSVEQIFGDIDPGYFLTSADTPGLATRQKTWFDNSVPAGNACMVYVLSCLHSLTGEANYGRRLEALRTAYTEYAQRAPVAVPHALAGFTADAMGIPVIKIKNVNVLPGLQKSLVARPWRRVFLQVTNDSTQPGDYMLCVGKQCMPPTDNPHTLAEMI